MNIKKLIGKTLSSLYFLLIVTAALIVVAGTAFVFKLILVGAIKIIG